MMTTNDEGALAPVFRNDAEAVERMHLVAPLALMKEIDQLASELNATLPEVRPKGVRRWNRTRVVIELLRWGLEQHRKTQTHAPARPIRDTRRALTARRK